VKKFAPIRLQRLVLIFCLLVCTGMQAQRCIKKSNKLIAQKKYRSAWVILDKADPKNENVSISLAKSDLLLKYFINTVMHQVFTLKDLGPTENVKDLRGKNENGNLIHFDPEEVLDSLLKKHPTDYRLYQGLGDYYYQVFVLFQEKWLKKPEDLVKDIEDDYTMACTHGLKTDTAEYRIGFARMFLQRLKESTESFLECIKLNPSYADSWYSLSYCYLQLGQADSALAKANQAYDLYKKTDTLNRSDVNLLRGLIYSSKKDTAATLVEYRKAAKLNPGNQSIYVLLLKAELKYNDKELKTVAATYFDMDPKGADTYSELINDYFEYNKSKEVLELLSDKLVQYASNPEVSGDILFYRAYIYVVMEDKDNAKKDLIEARQDFKKIFPSEHEMFGTIEEALKELDK